MKRGIWPIHRLFNQTVFDRVEMDVVHMMLEIHIIGDSVFPITSLPERVLAFLVACDRKAGFYDRMSERALDRAPPTREIVVARRQGPNGVKVIGKDDNCVNPERMLAPNRSERFAQRFNFFHQNAGCTVPQGGGKKEGSAWQAVAAVENHDES